MIQPLQYLPIQEIDVLLIVASDTESCFPNNYFGEYTACSEEGLLCMVEELHILQAVVDLREHAQERRIGSIQITLVRAIPHKLQYISDSQAGHDPDDASLNQLDHINAAPSFKNADLPIRLINDRPNSLSHHWFFQFQEAEEPMMAERIRAIVDETNGEIGVLEGWGGIYMIELIQAGIVGVMPGLAVADVLQLVWNRAHQGDLDGAYSAFLGVLPQINYSLQNMEFFHHAEKSLLTARGILPEVIVREATFSIGCHDQEHIDFLNRKVLEWLNHLGLPVNHGEREMKGCEENPRLTQVF